MRTVRIGLVLMLAATVIGMTYQPAMSAALPDVPVAQNTQTAASAADVQALIAKAKIGRREGQAVFSQHILSLAPYSVNLEYRPIAGGVAVHEKEAELFYVIDGSGTLITGGELVGGRRTNPTNLVGTAIQGGKARTIAKGDFAIVPEGTPHQISAVEGALVLMSFHVPRSISNGQ